MGFTVLIGACLLAFSLPVALFVFMVRTSAKLVILMVGSAFMWLLAALLTAIIWSVLGQASSDAQDNLLIIIVGVGMQEIFRFLYWKLLKRAEQGLNTLGDDGSGNSATRPKQALIAGLGFGLMSSVMQMNIVLNEASGPGTLPARGCPTVSIFVISALITMCFSALNVTWSIIMHFGLEQCFQQNKSWYGCWQVWFVIGTHYFASFVTYAGGGANGCWVTLVPLFILVIPAAYVAAQSSGLKKKEA